MRVIFDVAIRPACLIGLYSRPVLNCFRIDKGTTQVHCEIVDEERKRKRHSMEARKSPGSHRL